MTQNRLYYGDNLEVLRKYVRDETVDLCYIDPPFNSKRNYNQIYNNVGGEDRAQAQAFVDTWTWDDHANDCLAQILDNANGVQTQQSQALVRGLLDVLGKGSLLAYLVSMTVRIAEIHRTLKPTGSFYLHCDPTASHYLKLVCDAIFVPQGGDYKNEIVWKRSDAKGDAGQGSTHFGRVNDVIFFYTKGETCTWNPQYTPLDPDYVERFYKYTDADGRRYKLDNMLGPGGAAKGNPFYEVMGVSRYWRYSKEKMQELIKAGRVVQTKPGNVPMYKRYLNESKGVPLTSNWNDIDLLRGWSSERMGYPTQKPETLLERIISASSNEGDTVLDAYCGCGTSVVVAHGLKRKWVGIDITFQSISLILKRLREKFGAEAVSNVELHGIPRDMEGVVALVNKRDDRVRKEFEKWAVLTYSDNRAVINEKRGADKGVDGSAYVAVGRDRKGDISVKPVVFSVKSGKAGVGVVRDLRGTLEREDAAAGILITLEEPTEPMRREAKQAGQFKGDFATFDRLQVVTVREILDGARMSLPMYAEVVKRARGDSGAQQNDLFSGGTDE